MNGRMNFAESGARAAAARARSSRSGHTRGFLVTLYDWTGRPDEALREARAAVSATTVDGRVTRGWRERCISRAVTRRSLVDVDRMRTIAPVRAATLMAAETYDIEEGDDIGAAMRELAHGPSEYAEAIRGYTLARGIALPPTACCGIWLTGGIAERRALSRSRSCTLASATGSERSSGSTDPLTICPFAER